MIEDEYGKVVALSQQVVEARGWRLTSNDGPSLYENGKMKMIRGGSTWTFLGTEWGVRGRDIKYLHELIAIEDASQ